MFFSFNSKLYKDVLNIIHITTQIIIPSFTGHYYYVSFRIKCGYTADGQSSEFYNSEDVEQSFEFILSDFLVYAVKFKDLLTLT